MPDETPVESTSLPPLPEAPDTPEVGTAQAVMRALAIGLAGFSRRPEMAAILAQQFAQSDKAEAETLQAKFQAEIERRRAVLSEEATRAQTAESKARKGRIEREEAEATQDRASDLELRELEKKRIKAGIATSQANLQQIKDARALQTQQQLDDAVDRGLQIAQKAVEAVGGTAPQAAARLRSFLLENDVRRIMTQFPTPGPEREQALAVAIESADRLAGTEGVGLTREKRLAIINEVAARAPKGREAEALSRIGSLLITPKEAVATAAKTGQEVAPEAYEIWKAGAIDEITQRGIADPDLLFTPEKVSEYAEVFRAAVAIPDAQKIADLDDMIFTAATNMGINRGWNEQETQNVADHLSNAVYANLMDYAFVTDFTSLNELTKKDKVQAGINQEIAELRKQIQAIQNKPDFSINAKDQGRVRELRLKIDKLTDPDEHLKRTKTDTFRKEVRKRSFRRF